MPCYMGVNVVIQCGCVIFFAPRKVGGCPYVYGIWVLHGPHIRDLYVFYMGAIYEFYINEVL